MFISKWDVKWEMGKYTIHSNVRGNWKKRGGDQINGKDRI